LELAFLAPQQDVRQEKTGGAVRSEEGRLQTSIGEVVVTIQSALDTSLRETPSLIGSDKVEGSAVCRSNGNKVGTIERVMIDKIRGKVAYAVVSFGSFMEDWPRLLSAAMESLDV
jgi:hypothetical protein